MRPQVKFKVETGGVYIVRAFVVQDSWRASGNRARYQIGFNVRGQQRGHRVGAGQSVPRGVDPSP